MVLRFASVLSIVLSLMMSCPNLYAQEQEKMDPQEMMNRIDALERQLRRLEDESKARKSLEITQEEKTEQEKEVLEAVGREYTLSPRGTLALDYSLNYSYSPSEVFYTQEEQLQLRRNSDHTLQHSIYTSYSILDNLSTSLSIPILYRYNKMGTEEELDETDIGDISLGVSFQPTKSEAGDIRYTLNFTSVFPTGRSPYKINPSSEISTGNGVYQLSLGSSFSKQIDPVVLFWSIGYAYSFDLNDLDQRIQDTYTLDSVDLGDQFSASMGMAYALSYESSINMSFNYSYQRSSTLSYKELARNIETGDSTSASFGVGTGIRVSPKTTVSVSVGYSLVNAGFSISTRVPFNFML